MIVPAGLEDSAGSLAAVADESDEVFLASSPPPPPPPSKSDMLVQEMETLEAKLEEEVEKQLGLQALLEVMHSDEFDDESRQATQRGLTLCAETIFELEARLTRLEEKRRLLGNSDDDEATAEHTEAGEPAYRSKGPRKSGHRPSQVQHALADLESKIQQLEAELETEKQQPMPKQVIETMELFISGLHAERANLQAVLHNGSHEVSEAQDSSTKPEDEVAAQRTKRASKRVKILQELMTTEKEYIQDLQLCLQGYVSAPDGLRSAAAPSDMSVEPLFGNFDDVLDLAQTLYEALQVQAGRPVADQLIGGCICDNAVAMMDTYVKYCCHFEDAQELINEFNADPGKKAFLAKCQSSINAYTNCWDLGSFLIKPVQRILK